MSRAKPFATIIVERAFVALANGVAADLHRCGALRDADDQRAAIFQTAQAMLFHLLFLLFAESRDLLPLVHPVYARHSMCRLLEEMAAQPSLGEDDFWAWEWIQALLAATQTGYAEWGVLRYGDIGMTTNALEDVRIDTRHLSIALSVLGFDDSRAASELLEEHQLRDYATVDVTLLGEVYEYLLSCKLVETKDERRKTKVGKSNLSKEQRTKNKASTSSPVLVLQHVRAGRRASGSFYTPQHLANTLVEQTVGSLLAEHIARFENDSITHTACIDFTLLDPAMGCGTFLLAAIDCIAERLRDVYRGVRSDARALRHMILQRCIYGVDIDEYAVAITRLSLWLDCCVVGTPLDALDRQLRCGNSLIGGWLPTGDSLPLDLQAGLKLLGSASSSNEYPTTNAAYDRTVAPSKLLLDEVVSEKLYEGEPQTPHYIRLLAERHRFLHWELTFPAIFFDLAHGTRKPPDQAGFDVVIGNPPYITTLDRHERAYLTSWSTTRGRELDTCYVFVEQALRTLRPNGTCGMVMPGVWTTQSEAEPFRRYLLEYTLLYLHDLGFNVFSATVPVATFVVANCAPATDHLVAMRLRDGSERMVPQSVFRSLPSAQFNLELAEMLPLIRRIEAIAVPLATYTESHEGVHSGNIRHKLFTRAPESSARNSKRMLKGADIGRYSLQWDGWYVNYDPMLVDRTAGEYASLRDERIFTQPKIWTRQTGDRIIGTWDAGGFYSDNTLHSTQMLPDAPVSPLYLLALLNSRLLTFIYQQRTQEQGRPLAQVKLVFLRQLPIRRITFSTPQAQREQLVVEGSALAAAWIEHLKPNTLRDLCPSPIGQWLDARLHTQGADQSDIIHDLLAFLADQMLSLKRQQEAETSAFLSWLAAELHSDITTWKGKTIVQTYWVHPWEDIESTLRRNNSAPMLQPLLAAIRASWQASCSALIPMDATTKATERLIDWFVYRLYGLDDKEIALVEGDKA